jgi:hypothetical protein
MLLDMQSSPRCGAKTRKGSPGADRFGRNGRVCVPIPTLRLEEGLFVSFRTDRSSPFRPTSITRLETGHFQLLRLFREKSQPCYCRR